MDGANSEAERSFLNFLQWSRSACEVGYGMLGQNAQAYALKDRGEGRLNRTSLRGPEVCRGERGNTCR